MDAIKELYTAYTESDEDADTLEETEQQIFDYMKVNIPQDGKESFYDMIFSVMTNREECYFKAGFKTAVRLIGECI